MPSPPFRHWAHPLFQLKSAETYSLSLVLSFIFGLIQAKRLKLRLKAGWDKKTEAFFCYAAQRRAENIPPAYKNPQSIDKQRKSRSFNSCGICHMLVREAGLEPARPEWALEPEWFCSHDNNGRFWSKPKTPRCQNIAWSSTIVYKENLDAFWTH